MAQAPHARCLFPFLGALGLVWLLVLDSFNHCLSPAFLSHPVAFHVCGNILRLGGRGPCRQQDQALCLDPAGRHVFCSHSVSMQGLGSGRWVLFALDFHTFIEFLLESSVFLPSWILLCSAQGVFLSWSGVRILAFIPSCLLPHLLPYVRSQDSAVVWAGCEVRWRCWCMQEDSGGNFG